MPGEAGLRHVAEAALRQYDIRPRRITLAAESFNSVFRVGTDSAAYALRVGAVLAMHAQGTLHAEAAWLRRLQDDGFTVPGLLANRTGAVGTEVRDGQSRTRTCALFDWVAGRSLRGRLTAPTAAALGRLAARLHTHADSWSPTGQPDVLVAREALYWRLPVRLSTSGPPWSGVLTDALEQAQARLDELWQSPPHRPHLLHGDLTPANVIVAGRELVPIDFQDLAWGFDIQDLAITVAALRAGADAPRLVEGFRTGYGSLRSWPDVDPALFEALLAGRLLHQINLTLNLHEPGELTDYLSARAQRLRQWLMSGHLPG